MGFTNAMARPATFPTRDRQLKELAFVASSSSLLKFGASRFHRLNGKLNGARNASALPVIRAESSTTEYFPDAKFYKIEAILRPWRVPQVSSALLKMGIRGVTVSDVRGFGSQGGSTERQAGSEFSEDKFLAKVKMEIVVSKGQVEAVINKIIKEARTGEIGDGKIFLVPISDVIRIRTGERGDKGERMSGGRADMFSTS
ncbi:nitrogen regulatory protein P-II homolog [Rhodamnia argentea]|uniref:Nitrogen regulatory protein P-II homolog n=1 Tax=Rhodamnia argentea TaxID=178133 RepID=A0A8B8QST2_9MYRT|nr:nitrogen regulatory protein P-II homolog [Rhodamnia argentea]